MTAQQAVDCISTGLRQSHLRDNLEIVSMPLADGGDGTLETIMGGLGGHPVTVPVVNALSQPIEAAYGVLTDHAAVVEMARASGVEQIPRDARNPMLTTSYGTGELIRAAVQQGSQRLYIGLGGSACVEGGAGCLQALGVRLLDASGDEIPRGGAGLAQLARIDVSAAKELLRDVQITLLSDVTNPLCGALGAARVFGPQKGATPEMVAQLDSILAHFAAIIRRDVGVDVLNVAGAGAAGGFSAGLYGCLGAEIAPGGARIIELLGYVEKLAGVDLVITGEGKLDSQTVGGKAVQSIAEIAGKRQIPVVAIAGSVEPNSEVMQRIGLTAAYSLVPGAYPLDEALSHAAEWLTFAAEQLGNTLALKI
ncbi:MAG: glycerate kinase [Anaerolineae bacterium]|nr:glycerate kinase [Anaerolineae bacterium]